MTSPSTVSLRQIAEGAASAEKPDEWVLADRDAPLQHTTSSGTRRQASGDKDQDAEELKPTASVAAAPSSSPLTRFITQMRSIFGKKPADANQELDEKKPKPPGS